MFSMKCISYFALVWLQTCVIESSDSMIQDSCQLSITSDDGEKLNASSICGGQYKAEVCSTFGNSFRQEDLPSGMNTGLSVQKPSYIKVKGTYALNDEDHKYYPGLQIIWKSPASGGAMQSLKGFYVEMRSVDTDDLATCYLFKVDQSKELRKLVFELDLKNPEVEPNTTYTVRVYTIPPPQPGQRDDPEQFVSMRVVTNTIYGEMIEPGRWSPTISYCPDSSGYIEVCFNLAPPAFNFTRYNVNLLRQPNIFNSYKQIKHEVQDISASDECVKFEGLSSGDFSLTVQLIDLHRKVPGLCQCWINETTGKHCKKVCGIKTTRWFPLTVIAPAVNTTTQPLITTTPELTSTAEDPTTQGSTEPETTDSPVRNSTTQVAVAEPSIGSTNNSNGLLIGLTVALLVLLLLVGVGFVCWRRKWCRQKRKDLPSIPVPPPITGKDFLPNILPDSLKKSRECVVTCPPPALEKKKVYILSADDHPAHQHMVDCFAKFLEVHCHCDVIYPRFSPVHQDGGFPWVVANITRSNFVIFVDSRGAERLLRAHLDKMYYPHRELGPEGDLFTLGLKHVFSQQENEQVVPVCFHNVQACKKMLLASLEYNLPAHLPHFLLRIHQLNYRDLDHYAASLPVRVEVLNQLPEGSALLSAIEELKTYEKANPQWLETAFGQPAPIPNTAFQSSPTDSAYGSLSLSSQKALSVSNQDLSSRPASVFELPEQEEVMTLESGLAYSGNIANIQAQKLNQNAGESRDHYNRAVGGTRSEPEDLTDQSIFTIQTSSMMEGSEKACADAPPNKNHPQGGVFPDYSFVQGIIPPDSVSSVYGDSVSTALRGINERNDSALCRERPGSKQQVRGPSISESDGYSEYVDVVAPDSLSDVQIDSVSNALREVNARNELNFTRGLHELTVLDEVEPLSGYTEFDTMSV